MREAGSPSEAGEPGGGGGGGGGAAAGDELLRGAPRGAIARRTRAHYSLQEQQLEAIEAVRGSRGSSSKSTGDGEGQG